MVRLVTLDDLQRHPEFASKGISLNMHYDFKEDEETIVLTEEEIIIPTVNQAESVPIATVTPETVKGDTIELEVKPKNVKVKVAAKKVAPKKVAPKKVAVKKAAPKKSKK